MTAASRPTRRGPHGIRTILLAVSATLAFLLAAGGGIGLAVYLDAQGKAVVIERPDPGSGIDVDAFTGVCGERTCNYLILGSDSRAGLSPGEQSIFGSTDDVEGERSDTIMLVHVDTETWTAVVLSFPRDLWVEIPGRGPGKINSAFEGGPYLMAETITDLTGMEITHFVGVDLGGFRGIVDAMGGVPMCVDRPMFDGLTGLNIPEPGCYNFDGRRALAFVRTRNQPTDCIPDFARIGRQQQFLRAVLAKLLSPGQLWRIPRLLPEVVENLAVDEGFDILELAELAKALNGINTGNAEFRAVPTYPDLIRPPGFTEDVSIVQLKAEAKQLFRRLREGRPIGGLGETQDRTAISPANVRVRVFDAASGGPAAEVLSVLQRGGFNVAPELPSPGRLGVDEPVILYAPGAEDRAKVVARFVPGLELREAEAGQLTEVDVAVVIPSSYEPEPPGGEGAPPPEDPC